MMSGIQNHISQRTRQQYTLYLQDQLQKLSSFMLYQKKQNEKHNQLIRVIEDQNQKIKLLNDKVLLMELYQNQNLKNQQKLFNSVQKSLNLQKRINKIQYNWHQNKNQYRHANSGDVNSIKKQIMNEMENKINYFHRQLLQQMSEIENKLLRRLNLINQQTPLNEKKYCIKQNKKLTQSKDNMSPLQTNYSQNQRSQLRQFDKIQKNSILTQNSKNNKSSQKRQMKKIQKRINNYVNERLEKLQNDMTQGNKNNPSFYSSLQESQIYQQKQRSPISSYLKKQQQYNTNQQYTPYQEYNSKQQNITFNNKQNRQNKFYSACQTKMSKPKNKHKKSRSKSRSLSNVSNRSISNKSVSKSNRSKSIIKKQKEISHFRLNKQSSKLFKNPNKSMNIQRLNKKTEKHECSHSKGQNIHKNILKQVKKSLDKYSKKSIKKSNKNLKPSKHKKSNNISRLSQLSISQTSNCSGKSRSKSKSLTKIHPNQKQYLMCCDKLH